QATAAQLNLPYGVALDSLGNLFIADRHPNTSGLIRKVVLSSGIISTVISASLPEGASVDSANNLFYTNTFGSTVFRITPAGSRTLVAGNGTTGFSGDGSSALNASLFTPQSMAMDSMGNLFVADGNNQRVRRIDGATGVMTTVVGTGVQGYNGDNI